jgi:HlyD family secretion protein
MSARKKSRFWVWLLVLAVIAGGSYYGFKQAKPTKPSGFEIKTNIVTRGDLTQIITATGALRPVTNVQVGSQISGLINEVRVDFNTKVKEGDVLAQIDPASYERSVAQSEADLLSAKASLELSQAQAKRAASLRKDQLISQEELDKATADLHQTEAQVKIREASLERAKVDLQRTTIYSPINGLVISRNIDVGQTVAASFNTPTLFQIANDLSNMEIDAMVSEADVGAVLESQRVTFAVDAFPGRNFDGRIKQVRYAPTTNQNVVNYITVVSVKNPELKLRPGMTATASIYTAERTNVIRIPNAALRFKPPEGAPVKILTNAIAAKDPPSANSESSGARGGSGRPMPAGVPEPPWAAEGRRPTQDELRAWMDKLTPEQREAMRAMRGSRGGGGGGGEGGGGFGGGRSRGGSDRPDMSTVGMQRKIYRLVPSTDPTAAETVLEPISVKTGISDGSFTEITEGLKENDIVVTSVILPNSAAANRPGGSPFGGPFRPR